MTTSNPLTLPELPAQVARILNDFVQAAQVSFGKQLQSVVLYGSAAEGKLRPTSDVNVVLVLAAFEQNEAEQLREHLRVAQAAIQLRPMFLLREEIPPATRLFASKFADIDRRRVVLYGEDPFASTAPSREDEIRQLKQQLLNITLRLRSIYVARSPREEQLAYSLANAIGPLRSHAATLLELEGHPAGSPQEAFERLGAELAVPDWQSALGVMAAAQEARLSAPGNAGHVFFQLLEFTRLMLARVGRVPSEVHREPV